MLLYRPNSSRVQRLATVALLSSSSAGFSNLGCIAAKPFYSPQHHPWLIASWCTLFTTTRAAFNHNNPTLSSSSSTLSNSNADGSHTMGTTNNETRILQSLFSGTDNSHPHITIHHIKDRVVDSTQEEARRLVRETYDADDANIKEQQQQQQDGNNDPNTGGTTRFLAVIADQQQRGRGTQGRAWEGGNRRGNLFITICVPMDEIPVKLTLLPLEIAVLIATKATRLLQACRGGTISDSSSSNDHDDHASLSKEAKVTVKWPNDVLINDEKLAGVLIESESLKSDGRTWFLIGIGVNIAFTPSLSACPGKHLRGVTCIQDYCVDETRNGLVALPASTSHAFGVSLTRGLVDWILDKNVERDDNQRQPLTLVQQKEQKVLKEWKSFAQFGQTYELRSDDAKTETTGDYKGEKVVVLDIKDDGQLLVRGSDGRERLVIAEYMF